MALHPEGKGKERKGVRHQDRGSGMRESVERYFSSYHFVLETMLAVVGANSGKLPGSTAPRNRSHVRVGAKDKTIHKI